MRYPHDYRGWITLSGDADAFPALPEGHRQASDTKTNEPATGVIRDAGEA